VGLHAALVSREGNTVPYRPKAASGDRPKSAIRRGGLDFFFYLIEFASKVSTKLGAIQYVNVIACIPFQMC